MVKTLAAPWLAISYAKLIRTAHYFTPFGAAGSRERMRLGVGHAVTWDHRVGEAQTTLPLPTHHPHKQLSTVMASRDGDGLVSQPLPSRILCKSKSFYMYSKLIISDRRAVQRAQNRKHHFPRLFNAAVVASLYDTARWIVSAPIGKATNAPAKSLATPPHPV